MEVDKSREVAARANAFVKGNRVAEIKSQLGNELMLYETIRNHNIRATKADCMLAGQHKMAPYQDGMVDMGDGRLLGGGLKMAFTTKRILTTSFNPDWTCTRCEQHSVRHCA
jgi:hypothetical protein